MQKVRVINYTNGAYLPEHLFIVQQCLGQVINVTNHGFNFYKSNAILANGTTKVFLVCKNDCQSIN